MKAGNAIRILLLCCALLVSTSLAWGQWPEMGVLICRTAIPELPPRCMAPDGAGGAIIAWCNFEPDVYAQRIDSMGNILWAQKGVPICIDPSSYQRSPTVVHSEDGATFILWANHISNGYLSLSMQKIDINGNAIWPTNGVLVCQNIVQHIHPFCSFELAPDGAGGAYVALFDFINDRLLVQWIDSNGNRRWGANGLIIIDPEQNFGDTGHPPNIIPDGTGGAIIAWMEDRLGGLVMLAQRVNQSGTKLWPAAGIPLCTAGSIGMERCLASDGEGGAIALWEAMGIVAEDVIDMNVHAQRIDPYGNLLWGPEGISVCSSFGFDYCFRIASDTQGGVFVTWMHERSNNISDLFAQRIDAEGNKEWSENGLLVAAANDMVYLDPNRDIAFDGSDGAIIVFLKCPIDGESSAYAQRIDGNGQFLWGQNGIPVSASTWRQENPQLVLSGLGSAIVAFFEWRMPPENLSYEGIYAMKIPMEMANSPPAPTIDPLPIVSGECPGPVVVTPPSADDDHDGVITGVTVDPLTYTAPGAYIVHWTYTDSGNLTTAQDQTVEIVDSMPPELACPSDRTFTYGQVIDFGQPAATDACCAEVTITFSEVTTPGSCPEEYSIARTWQAADCNGNSSSCLQTVTVIPNTSSGTDVTTQPIDSATGSSPVTLNFETVTESGQTTLEVTSQGPPPPAAFRLGSPPTYYQISTGAVFTGVIEVCIDYGDVDYPNETKLKLMHFENDAWIDCTTSLDVEANIICGQVISLSYFAVFEEYIGAAAGRVYGDCPEAIAGLYGVTVDLFENGTGILAGTAATDVNGSYRIADIEAGGYTLTLVLPLGYSANAQEIPVIVPAGDSATTEHLLTCLSQTGDPRGIGFWKHQVGVARGGKGNAAIDAATLCSYLDAIEIHFNSNAIHQVVVYEPPESGDCLDKLEVARVLLNLEGHASMSARARQQLMALLLNVSAGRILLNSIVSEDGATASQAITYCDELVTDLDPANDEIAKTIADLINSGITVPAKTIPLETQNIAYGSHRPESGPPEAFDLGQNRPNPFNPATQIDMKMPEATSWTLAIYDVSGRMVKQFRGSTAGPGIVSIIWDGSNDRGESVETGIYLYVMRAGAYTAVKKMVILR